MDEKVRPELDYHGGNILIEKLVDKILHVRMTGQCSGCPSADLTMESLVDAELTAAFPELEKVVLVTGVSESLINEAKAFLKMRHSEGK